MSELEIRVAGPGDAVGLAALVAGFRDHLRAEFPDDRQLERHLPEVLADPATEFCCAWLGAEPVGYTQMRFFPSIWAGGTEAHLEDLFVVLAARGRAVGSALLRFAIARAEMRGARALALTTNEQNVVAQQLYRSEGLHPDSHRLWPGGREVLWTRALGSS